MVSDVENNAVAGCASVQRLVAEYIPRYASHCPLALEAATNAVISIHKRCFKVITRAEENDIMVFDTAKACAFGLVGVCEAAASEASNSVAMEGICSAVFLNVISFYMSTFEGKDIFDIVDQRVLKIHDVADSFSNFKCEFLGEDNSMMVKLSKIHVLCLLKIFFSCPKYTLVACFELFESVDNEAEKGNYFLRQLTIELGNSGVSHLDGISKEQSTDGFLATKGGLTSDNTMATMKNCLLGLVCIYFEKVNTSQHYGASLECFLFWYTLKRCYVFICLLPLLILLRYYSWLFSCYLNRDVSC